MFRFMIETTFAEAGVSIAYLRRDLHLEMAKRLRFELVRDAKPNPRQLRRVFASPTSVAASRFSGASPVETDTKHGTVEAQAVNRRP